MTVNEIAFQSLVLFAGLFTTFATIGLFCIMGYRLFTRNTRSNMQDGQYAIRIKQACLSTDGSPRIVTNWLTTLACQGAGLSNMPKQAKSFTHYDNAMIEFTALELVFDKRFGEPSVILELVEKQTLPLLGETWSVINKKVY